jgi:hypothetical protein
MRKKKEGESKETHENIKFRQRSSGGGEEDEEEGEEEEDENWDLHRGKRGLKSFFFLFLFFPFSGVLFGDSGGFFFWWRGEFGWVVSLVLYLV